MSVETVPGDLADRQVRASLVRLLNANVLAAFATVGPRGRAHIHTAYFAWSDDWSLIFYSYPDSRHCRNLERRTSMAVAIFDSHQRWGRPDRGVQLFGTCKAARGSQASAAERVYAARFPGFARWRRRNETDDGTFRLRPFRFRPHRAKLFDEPSLGSGRFVEVPIPRRRASAGRG